MFTSGMPVELLENTALKFQHFFRGYILQYILCLNNIFIFPNSVQLDFHHETLSILAFLRMQSPALNIYCNIFGNEYFEQLTPVSSHYLTVLSKTEVRKMSTNPWQITTNLRKNLGK